MPSSAYGEYQKNLTDVHRLVLLHGRLSGSGPGKRSLGHLTRGGLLLLCAAWERYVETAANEAAAFLTLRLPAFTSLPANVQQKVTAFANKPKNGCNVADLQIPAWKNVYLTAVRKRTDDLNAPKHKNLQPLFQDFFAIPDIATYWMGGATPVDDFVSLRGEVAHRGGQAQYVHFSALRNLEVDVAAWVKQTDNALTDHVRTLVTPYRRPWNRVN